MRAISSKILLDSVEYLEGELILGLAFPVLSLLSGEEPVQLPPLPPVQVLKGAHVVVIGVVLFIVIRYYDHVVILLLFVNSPGIRFVSRSRSASLLLLV